MDFPYTAEDLETIAKRLRAWERRLIAKEGGYSRLSEGVGDIEVLRPDSEDVIGKFVLQDEWLGFVFKPAEPQ
jgi:hypothetical protein